MRQLKYCFCGHHQYLVASETRLNTSTSLLRREGEASIKVPPMCTVQTENITMVFGLFLPLLLYNQTKEWK